ncbi:predicted protein [Nematostella vectensis]|uniref:Uncharacterized protein n=1 Tax=Nematostella vectensis TaxID=45351 RepID=A7SIZ7_NEMVE|nr:predicted protein [Nematostella vectensis]|eukprot:XP_001628371.1 predicted protein [Nematostella vectensis]
MFICSTVDGGFSEWSQWSLCDNPCGGSVVNRTRTCTNPTPTPDGKPCKGDYLQTKLECIAPCKVTGGYTLWSSWTSCTKTCGTGMQKRSRDCTNPRPIHGGQNCTGDYVQTKSCKLKVCPGK